MVNITLINTMPGHRQDLSDKSEKGKMKNLIKFNILTLVFLLASTPCLAQENRSKVGIRPYPRDSAHEMTGGDRVANWKPGIGNYDDILKADDYTALHMDAVKGYDGVFRTKNRFFEYYIGMRGMDWVDSNPETNTLVSRIQKYEKKGNVVKHIIICREEWLYKKNGDKGPIDGDPRILHQKDVEDTRKVFKDAHALGLLKHDNYKLIQMVVHPAVFLDDPKAREIVKTMDGICIESHQFNRYWPLGNEISNPEEIARGANWALKQGLEYIFYYGPYRYKGCDNYTENLEREWLKNFWERGLPKHHENMYYYLNSFPHGCGNTRPVGPESDPDSYLGFAKWLIQELEHGE